LVTRGDGILEHAAGVEDYEIAEATYQATLKRWITMRQGARVIQDSRRLRVVK